MPKDVAVGETEERTRTPMPTLLASPFVALETASATHAGPSMEGI